MKKIMSEFHQSITENDSLKLLLDTLQNEEDEEEVIKQQEEEEQEEKIVLMDGDEFRVTIRKKKPKKISQKYLIIFDDISTELTNPHVSQLLKTNRHYKSKVIISSQ